MTVSRKFAHIAALALIPIAAHSGTMWLAGEGTAPFPDPNNNNHILCDIANSSSLGVNQSTSCAGQVVLDFHYGALQGTVASGGAQIFAAAQVGTLKTLAEADGSNLPHAPFSLFNLGSSAWAAASFQDMINVQPPGVAPGTHGFMQPVFSVQGPVSEVGSPLGFAAGVFVMTADNFNSGTFGDHAADFVIDALPGDVAGYFLIDPVGVTSVIGTAQGRTFTSNPIPIVFGTPHPFSAHLESSVGSCGNCNSLTPSQLITFTGIADLSHTANLTGFIVTDAGGNPLQGSSIIGSGGFDYNSLGGSAAVPEPASWMLFACAGALLWRKRIGKKIGRAKGK